MKKAAFTPDFKTEKPLLLEKGARISEPARRIPVPTDPELLGKGDAFCEEIARRYVADFEKEGDRMAHVSTFLVRDGIIYMAYYANTKEPSEDPKNQTARFAYASVASPDEKVFFDLQTTGDTVDGEEIVMVYDTILMEKDEDTLYIMWTASTEGNYYRFYCPFTLSTRTMGELGINRFRVGEVVNDLSQSGIKSALSEAGIPVKNMFADIGIMQKQSYREENGVRYCYTGLYSGDFTCLIKSSDLITWEYVSQPDFVNDSVFENATFVLGDTVYQFIRQQPKNPCGFLTALDLTTGKWAPPVEIEDCQSRADFIYYRGGLYLFHAPLDREHIGIVRVDTEDITKSEVLLVADMKGSCFYPFVEYFEDGELGMSYTVDRKHIRLARFSLSDYL